MSAAVSKVKSSTCRSITQPFEHVALRLDGAHRAALGTIQTMRVSERLRRLHESGRLKSIVFLLIIIATLAVWAFGLIYLSG